MIRDSESDESDAGRKRFACSRQQKPRKQSIRVTWTEDELKVLKKAFATFRQSQTLPGFAVIKTAQKAFPVLLKRTPAQIKSRFCQLLKMLNKPTE